MKKDRNDIVLAIFIKRMKIAFLRKRIKYINELNEKINYEEELLIDDTIFSNSSDIYKLDELQQLSKDEIEILELFYIYGYSYKEISKIKSEKAETIRKRRNRAVDKLRKNRRDNNGL